MQLFTWGANVVKREEAWFMGVVNKLDWPLLKFKPVNGVLTGLVIVRHCVIQNFLG